MNKYKLLYTLVLLVSASMISAQTTIPGGNVSGTWDLSGSPYTITGDVTVPGGSDISIEPGVHIFFNGNVALFVDGTLHAIGTESDSITFARTQPSGPGWEGIRFWEANSGSEIAYAVIESANSSGGTYPDNYGGGVFIRSTDNVIIRNSTFRENVASFGGAIYTAVSNVEIHHNVFESNQAGAFGSAISMLGGGAHVWNNTFINNDGTVIHFELPSQTAIMENNILYDQSAYFEGGNDAVVRYNILYSTSLIGTKPAGLGVVSTVNINGDPADQYMNIFLNPEFVNVVNGDYHLVNNSPAIDAGNPATVYDPDNTIADIGAFYFDQSTGSPVVIDLTPLSQPVVVPETGGDIDFSVYVENVSASAQNFDAWIDISYEGTTPTTVVQRSFSNYLPGWTVNRPNAFFPVPGSYAAGSYDLTGRVGNHPVDVWDESGFPFAKEGMIDGMTFAPWTPDGFEDPFAGNSTSGVTPPVDFVLLGAYPNPFNPTTAISYQLSANSQVNLTVYDISGSLVAQLVNGHRDAGTHVVTFDASDLTSGVYIYRLAAGDFSATGKMVLMK